MHESKVDYSVQNKFLLNYIMKIVKTRENTQSAEQMCHMDSLPERKMKREITIDFGETKIGLQRSVTVIGS